MEKLLRLDDVAIRLNTTPGRAQKVLNAHQTPCVDYGAGRGGGKRWAATDIDALILRMRQSPAPKKTEKKAQASPSILTMKPADLFALTHTETLQ